MTKAQRVLVTSPVICTMIGTLVGSILMPALVGTIDTPSEAFEMTLGLLPWAAIYSAPVGLVCGLLGAVMSIRLGNGPLRGAPRKAWLRVGAGWGAVTGSAVLALLFPLLGSDALAFEITGLIAGGISGVALGLVGWRQFGSASLPIGHALGEAQ